MLDIERIRQLVDMMIAHDLTEISLRDGDQEVSLRRPNANESAAVPLANNPASGSNSAVPTPPPETAEADPDAGLVEIRSPMVGTFYASPDPESEPFVPVGTRVHANAVVCIIEAMKVFNEIKAEVGGTIDRCLVKNEQTVEYGQPLFLVRPE